MAVSWPEVLEQASGIVRGYSTGVTLRQLFYRLVAGGTIPNTRNYYTSLARYTARARREAGFPRLIDLGRIIHRPLSWDGPEQARAWLHRAYRRNRTEGQEWAVYVAAEKAGQVALLEDWFSDRGLPILAVGGYSGQTFVEDVTADVHHDGRPAVLLYASDWDASGECIDRDFLARTDCFHKTVRVALTGEQVSAYALPEQPGKARDPRAARFVARYGRLVQVEMEALPPDVLRELFEDALSQFWSEDTYRRVLENEAAERGQL